VESGYWNGTSLTVAAVKRLIFDSLNLSHIYHWYTIL